MVSRWVAMSGGALVLAVVAAGLAEATLAVGHIGGITDGSRVSKLLHETASVTPSPSPSASIAPTATPTPLPTAAPSLTPVSTPVVPTAITNSFVHLRAGASTSTGILADLNGGTRVELLPYSDSQWQQVRYNGLSGYIYKSYLNY